MTASTGDVRAAAVASARGLLDVELDGLPADAVAGWARLARPVMAALVDEAAGEGRRAHSRVTLVVEVIHDGQAQVLGEHLAVEVDAVLARWGHDVDGVRVADVEVIAEGDSVSRWLPAVGGRS